MIHFIKKIRVSRTFLILMGQSVAVGLLLMLISGWVFPYTMDSMIYISTAEHIVRFKGLLFTNFFIPPAVPDVLPLDDWPPGFPMSIAILKWAGINEYVAALILPRVCCLSLPFLFFGVFRKFVPDNVSFFASGMCSLTFSVLACSTIAWSDTPYLALTLLVLIMMFNIIERKALVRGSIIVLAGVLSGTAVLIKYLGISLIVSVGMCLIVGTVIRMVTLKDFIRTVCLYGLGICLPVVPYCIRNLIVFGVMGVYQSSTAKADFIPDMIFVIRLYLQGLSSMIFGIGSFAWIIPIFIACFVIWFLGSAKHLMREHQTKFICLLLVVMYFFIHSIFLIYYRSVALILANPDVDDRLLMQLSWILLGGVIFAVHGGPSEMVRIKRC